MRPATGHSRPTRSSPNVLVRKIERAEAATIKVLRQVFWDLTEAFRLLETPIWLE